MQFFFKKQSHQSGFTLIELILAISIFTLLVGLATVNLSNIHTTTSLAATLHTLVTDIKAQQTKAMVGDTEGRVSSDAYGVHFEINRYILFHGPSYSSTDPSNFTVNLNNDLNFAALSFSASSVIFLPLSGEVSGFVDGQDSATIKNTQTGEQKTIKINRYGILSNIY